VRLEKKEGALDLITQAEALSEYRGVRSDLGRFGAAMYAIEFVDEMTPEALPQREVFEILRGTLERLDAGAPVAEAVFAFEGRMLRALGYEPRMAECGMCRARLSGPEAYFSARDGGAVCARCPPRDATRLLLRRPVFDAIAAFCAGRTFTLALYPTFVDDLRRAMDYYVRFLAQREFKSARFMREAVLRRVSIPGA
jgi:DNA repair protein RecO